MISTIQHANPVYANAVISYSPLTISNPITPQVIRNVTKEMTAPQIAHFFHAMPPLCVRLINHSLSAKDVAPKRSGRPSHSAQVAATSA